MYQLTIRPPETGSPRRRGPAPKSRGFTATALAWITGRELWPDPTVQTDHLRPLWLMVAGADRTLIPFLANLRAGRAADLTSGPAPSYRSSSPPRLELLKSAGYRLQWQRNCGVDGASVVTLDQSPLVDLEPGAIHPSGLSFLCLPPRWWVAQETARLRADPAQYQVGRAQCQALGITEANRPAVERLLAIPLTLTVESMLDLVPQAAYFAAYLDRRTLRPLIQDRAFDLQLYLAALHQGIASLSQTPASLQRHQSYYNASGPDPADPWWWVRHAHYADFQEVGTTAIGLLPGVACTTTHATLDTFLAAEVQRYLAAQSTAPGL